MRADEPTHEPSVAPDEPSPGSDEPAEAGGRSTVGRIALVLEALATTDGGVGPRSLARDSGIDRSAASRILRQLADVGLAVPADIPGRYAVGPRLFAIAGAVAARDELRTAARPALEALAVRFNETTYLATLESDRVVYRDVIQSTQPIRYVAELGIPSPLHAGAAGRAVLAGLDDIAFEAWLSSAELASLTPDTIRDGDVLRTTRATDRTRGYAVSRGERVPGGAAVAAPFVDGAGRVRGSLVVSLPAERLPGGREREIGTELASRAGELSRRLGATPASTTP
jgi:IclR family acetate operon transcriptional repressor